MKGITTTAIRIYLGGGGGGGGCIKSIPLYAAVSERNEFLSCNQSTIQSNQCPMTNKKILIRKASMKKQELTFRFETKVKPTSLLTLLATTRPFTATFVCAK